MTAVFPKHIFIFAAKVKHVTGAFTNSCRLNWADRAVSMVITYKRLSANSPKQTTSLARLMEKDERIRIRCKMVTF